MKIDIVTREEFEGLVKQINELKDLILNAPQGQKQYLTSKDVREMLQISENTLSSFRKKGIIPYIQLESKHYTYEADAVANALRERQSTKITSATAIPRFSPPSSI
jgi:hypothetical protein